MCVSRVNYEISRLSKLHEDARRSSKDFQQFWYELEMFKVCRDDMPCEVKKNAIWRSFGGVEKVEKFIEKAQKKSHYYLLHRKN